MRAVAWKGPGKVSIDQVPDPRIESATDVLVRISTAGICGSDLHMYEGRTAAKPGVVMGHENMGVIEKVGDQAKDLDDPSHEQPTSVIEQLAEVVNPTGAIGVIGVFLPEDPGGRDEAAKKGTYPVPWGQLWEKGIQIGTGQTPVRHYSLLLRDLIIAGRAKPSFIVSRRIPLAEAPDAYRRFDRREPGYTKVLIKPTEKAKPSVH